MKTIGLIGGISWESSAEYYRVINVAVKERLGGLHSGKILMYSAEFHEIQQLQHDDQWDKVAAIMIDIAQRLETAGADYLIICSNTMHRVAKEVQRSINIPLLHIADATAYNIKQHGIGKVGLLGTRFTMEQDFYRKHLIEEHGLEVLIPTEKQRILIHNVIYNELCLGKFLDKSRNEYLEIIEEMVERGAEGIILGCTEIPLLVKQDNTSVPIFDTTVLHALKAVDLAIEGH